MKKYVKSLIASVLILSMSLAACNPVVGPSGNGTVTVQEVVFLDISGYTDWDYLVAGEDSSSIFIRTDHQTRLPTEMYVKLAPDSDAGITYLFKPNGLVDYIIYNNSVAYFDNFSGYTFDIVIVYPNGDIIVQENVQTDINWDIYNQPVRSVLGRSVIDDVFDAFGFENALDAVNFVAGHALGVISCVSLLLPNPPGLLGCGLWLGSVVGSVVTKVLVMGDIVGEEFGSFVDGAFATVGCLTSTPAEWINCVVAASQGVNALIKANWTVVKASEEEMRQMMLAEATPPGSVFFFEVKPDIGGKVELSWEVNSSPLAPNTRHQVQMNSDAWISLGANATEYTFNDLELNRDYIFRVRASNEKGDGTISTRTVRLNLPRQVTDLTPIAGDRIVRLDWKPVGMGANIPAVTHYQVSRDGGTTWASTDSLSPYYLITGLINNNQYPFQVRAINAVGPGPASATVYATPVPSPIPDGAPGAVPNFEATPGNEEVTLSWGAAYVPSGPPVTGYQVLKDNGSWVDLPLSDFDSTVSPPYTYTFTGLTNGTEYTFEVRAVNGVGSGGPISELTATPVNPARVIDLSVGTGSIEYDGATGSGVVIIKGITNGARSIFLQNVTDVYIEDNTRITGQSTATDTAIRRSALQISNPVNVPVTIHGGGPDITITGGSGTRTQTSEPLVTGGQGISSSSDLTISGTIGNITGGNSGNSNAGNGISSSYDLTISGTIGNITGGDGTNISAAGIWLYGRLTISGSTGIIQGGNTTNTSAQRQGGSGIYAGYSSRPGNSQNNPEVIITETGSIGDDTADSLRGGTNGTGARAAQMKIWENDRNNFPRTTPKPWTFGPFN